MVSTGTHGSNACLVYTHHGSIATFLFMVPYMYYKLRLVVQLGIILKVKFATAVCRTFCHKSGRTRVSLTEDWKFFHNWEQYTTILIRATAYLHPVSWEASWVALCSTYKCGWRLRSSRPYVHCCCKSEETGCTQVRTSLNSSQNFGFQYKFPAALTIHNILLSTPCNYPQSNNIPSKQAFEMASLLFLHYYNSSSAEFCLCSAEHLL